MYTAHITTINNIRKHSNADRLQCCEIFGNNVIVDLSYQIGQKVVFFPTDGQLDYNFALKNNLLRIKDENGNNIGGYLDANKRNITALRLRGEKSEGLVLPIECLAEYVDITTLYNGMKITTLNGYEICKKYIPAVNNRHYSGIKKNVNKKEESKTISYPYFTEHIDTEQLAYNQQSFREGDIIYITQKLHGTSGRTSNTIQITKKNSFFRKLFKLKEKEKVEYHCISGTRRVILRDYNGGYYGNNKFREKYNEMFTKVLPKGMTVYYEIVGWVNDSTPIMPRCQNSKVKDKEFSAMYGKETVFTYGCQPGENECYVYRITMTNDEGVAIEIPTEETKKWCDRLGVKFVPVLEKFLYTTWEDLNERCKKYMDIPEPLSYGKHITEGVVVRIDNRSKFTAYKAKSFNFKVLEGIIKDSAECPDIEEAQDLL